MGLYQDIHRGQMFVDFEGGLGLGWPTIKTEAIICLSTWIRLTRTLSHPTLLIKAIYKVSSV